MSKFLVNNFCTYCSKLSEICLKLLLLNKKKKIVKISFVLVLEDRISVIEDGAFYGFRKVFFLVKD